MERIADFRKVFAEVVVARGRCPQYHRLLQAFAAVPRHEFLGPGPWMVSEDGSQTLSDDPATVFSTDSIEGA